MAFAKQTSFHSGAFPYCLSQHKDYICGVSHLPWCPYPWDSTPLLLNMEFNDLEREYTVESDTECDSVYWSGRQDSSWESPTHSIESREEISKPDAFSRRENFRESGKSSSVASSFNFWIPFSNPNIDSVKSRVYDSIKVCAQHPGIITGIWLNIMIDNLRKLLKFLIITFIMQFCICLDFKPFWDMVTGCFCPGQFQYMTAHCDAHS